MTYEELIENVGGCGLYQKLILSLLYTIPVLDGLQIGSFIFIVPEIRHRCSIPGLLNDTYEVQQDSPHGDLITASIPRHIEDGTEEYNRCYLYDNETLNGNRTQSKCSSWVYDKSHYHSSATSDMNLVCDREIYTSHAKTAFFVGAFIMFLVGGWISDRFGRKIIIVFCVLIQGVSSLASSQVNNIYLLLIFRCLSAIGGAGGFGAVIVLVTEITSKKHRSLPSLLLQIAFPVAFLMLSIIAYFIRKWRLLMILISVPLIPLALILLWVLPESPRWLIHAKKEKKLVKLLNRMAKINKQDFIYQPEKEVEIDEKTSDRSVKLWKIFTVPILLKRTLIMMFNWAATIFVYYGVTLNVGALAGNVYLNLALNSFLEIPAIVFAAIFLDRFGRRKISMWFLIISGVSGMLTIFPYLYASKDQYWTATALITLSRLTVSAATACIYLYTCELYPTCIRNASVGFFGAFARFGGILSPYIMNISNVVPGRFGKSLPLMVMGLTCLVAGISYFFLPETANQPMMDTIEEMIKNEYRKKRGKTPEEIEETHELQV